ncbi:FAD binding domain-containing protein [Pseudovirgaria hyperparasitica]|uniref:Delta(24)-sterol reductase n=1 Tax=Pseudovirgaria hyperparasitica TaxID=470096 RepID=A0A6A6VVP7_9PEZI|nr:FAD binding domain-containing protein [Pseudovirgaria hyperparasitica]KAF2753866.1 FAD binding domain-containing protein [Pseudovirgaria hyperparasitica]
MSLLETHQKYFRASKEHDEAVKNIADCIRQFYEQETPFRIYHGVTNSTRNSTRRADQVIDISCLNNVLEVCPETREVLVEPNVSMDYLLRETLKHGLLPAVVPEFPGITVGGAFSGTAGESSSFRHGLFQDTVEWIEIILGNGSKLYAGRNFNSDLYRGARSSFGTLGVLTQLCVKLIPAKTHVLLEYHKVKSFKDATNVIDFHEDQPDTDYLDGIMFADNAGVICVGKLEDMPLNNCRWPERRFTGPWDPWFYMNAKTVIESRSKEERKEYIPIKDYLFRYDRAAFWMSKYTFNYFFVPNISFTRWLFNTYTKTQTMYHALHASGLSNKYIIQDIMIPYSAANEFFSYLGTNFEHYPVWLCPLGHRNGEKARSDSVTQECISNASDTAQKSSFSPSEVCNDKMLNFGVWGPAQSGNFADFVAWNRALEAKVEELQGRKWLYGHTFYTEKEFWSIYDRKQLDMLRAKYHASYLPTLYDKVKGHGTVTSTWFSQLWNIRPLPGLYGW